MRWIGVALLFGMVACGGDAPSENDPATDAGPGGADAQVAFAPEPPVLTPCPDGWTETVADGLTLCEPGATPVRWPCPDGWEADGSLGACRPTAAWGPVRSTCPAGWRTDDGACAPYAGAGPVDCPAHEMHLPGQEGCRPIWPCGVGPFAADIPSGANVFYVAEGGQGDGSSPTAPRGALTQADLDGLSPGAVVALGAGRQVGPFVVSRDVTFWGLCPSLSTIAGSGIATRGAVLRVLGAPNVTVIGLRLDGQGLAGVRAEEGARLTLRGVEVDAPTGVGLNLTGPTTLEAVAVSGAQPNTDGQGGRSIQVFDAGAVEARGLALLDSWDASLIVFEGTARIDEAVLTGRFDARTAAGVVVRDGSRVELSRAALLDNTQYGAYVTGGTLVLEDVSITRTRATDPEATGDAVLVTNGGTVEAERLWVEDPEVRAFRLIRGGGDPGRATLTDVVLRDRRGPRAAFGVGLAVPDGTSVRAQRLLVVGFPSADVTVEAGSELSADDLRLVAAGQPRSRGISVQGGRADLRRVAIEGHRRAAAVALGEGSDLRLADVHVTGPGTAEVEVGDESAVAAADGGRIELRRAVIRDAPLLGVDLCCGGRSEIEDLVVERTRPLPNVDVRTNASGIGLLLRPGAEAAFRRIAVNDSTSAGVAVIGAQLTGEGLLVRQTRPDAAGRGGRGLIAEAGATVNLRSIHLEDNYGLGVGVDDSAAIIVDALIRGRATAAAEPLREDVGLFARGSRVDLRRIRVEQMLLGAVQAVRGAELFGGDILVRGTLGGVGDPAGWGIVAEESQVQIERAAVFRTRVFGAWARGEEARLELRNAVIDDVGLPACASATPACQSTASGVGSLVGGTIDLFRVRAARAFACGLFVGAQSHAEAEALYLEDNDRGACFEDSDYDLDRLDAHYEGNNVRVEFAVPPASPEPLPDPTPAFGD